LLAPPYSWQVRLLQHKLALMEAQSEALPRVRVLSLVQGLVPLERLPLVGLVVRPQAQVFCLGLAMERRVLALAA
jgi:hypothetical protein